MKNGTVCQIKDLSVGDFFEVFIPMNGKTIQGVYVGTKMLPPQCLKRFPGLAYCFISVDTKGDWVDQFHFYCREDWQVVKIDQIKEHIKYRFDPYQSCDIYNTDNFVIVDNKAYQYLTLEDAEKVAKQNNVEVVKFDTIFESNVDEVFYLENFEQTNEPLKVA